MAKAAARRILAKVRSVRPHYVVAASAGCLFLLDRLVRPLSPVALALACIALSPWIAALVRSTRRFAAPVQQSMEDRLFSIGVAENRYGDPLAIGRHHAKVYSQSGEDGIIAEVFRRIGPKDRFFVEIGAGDGRENNTRLLLEQGWRGIWLEGNGRNAARARQIFAAFVDAGALKVVEAFITRENIDALLDAAAAPEAFDFLSLDLDQNTSHIWRALRRRARVACIEYNATLPAATALEVPYDDAGSWEGTNWFGASLKALERIGSAKSMHLVGCDLMGFNAFFVAADETAGRFRQPFTAEAHWEPARYRLSADHIPPAQEARRWIVSTSDQIS